MRPDDVHNFLMEAHRISQEAQFIVDSLPNAEQPAVEWVLHQLSAICTILTSLDDPHSAPETILALEAYVNGLIQLIHWKLTCQIFIYLTDHNLLDRKNPIHCACLFLVYQPRIQASLDRTRDDWNHHKIRTERNKTPLALYEISREAAMKQGYWTGDPGDDLEDVLNDPEPQLQWGWSLGSPGR
ncbi:hypothetical protein B0H14DRAFT_2358574 [Mycena olivaceomarginata]|nr:hypothetical protein B0H14DRAFT_2358574 [Mycena olivaceomarginata]